LLRNIALLTPIQEALLSFLFPFVWQGSDDGGDDDYDDEHEDDDEDGEIVNNYDDYSADNNPDI
jgi:hypothetical protein